MLGGVESGTESGQMTKPVLEVRHADSICGSDTARDQHLILRMVQKDQLLEPLVNAGGLTLGAMRDAVDVDDGVNLLPRGTLCHGARNVEEFETPDGKPEKTEPSEGVVIFRRFGGR